MRAQVVSGQWESKKSVAVGNAVVNISAELPTAGNGCMPLKKRLIAALFVVCLCAKGLFAQSIETVKESSPVYFYASEFSLPGVEMAAAQKTIDVIRQAISPRELKVVQLTSIVEVDRIFREPGQFVAVVGASTYWRHLRDGIRDIATLVSDKQPDPDHAVGALIVVSESHPEIQSLKDLRGKRIGVNAPNGFQGIQVVFREIAEQGMEWRTFFSEVRSYGLDYRLRLEGLRNGEVDAATVNVCYAERMAEKGIDVLKGFRPIAVKKQSLVPCLTSTRLYPNWSLLASPELDSNTRIKIANAVYAMKPVSDGQRWTMASDFRETDELYRVLKTGPYEYLNSWTLSRFLQEFKWAIALVLLLLVGWAVHTLRARHLIRVKSEQLQQAFEKQQALTRLAEQTQEKYQAMRHAFTVNQLSSMVAHELSQPLASILLYAQGLSVMIRNAAKSKTAPDLVRLGEGVDKIASRAAHAQEIVRLVRSNAKADKPVFVRLDLAELVSQVIGKFVLAKKITTRNIVFECDKEKAPVEGSPLELELAVFNLLQNSLEAALNVSQPFVEVRLVSVDEKHFALVFTDNAPAVDDELIERIREPVKSLKPQGLGLGLSIVHAIVEKHYARLEIDKHPIRNNVRVTMVFPVASMPVASEREESAE